MVVGEPESELGLDACALRVRQSWRCLHCTEFGQASGGLSAKPSSFVIRHMRRLLITPDQR